MRGYGALCGVLAVCAIALSAPAVRADILKFTDEDGVLHFTDRGVSGKHEVFMRAHAPLPRSVMYDANRWRYMPLVRAAAVEHGVNAEFIACVIEAESGFNPGAISAAGARGLMQLMPSTAMRYRVDNPFDPASNILGGTRHLKSLLQKYRGSMKLALAAYNAGEDAVAKYNGIPPFRETREYVAKILQRYNKSAALSDGAGARKKIYRYTAGDGSILLTDTPRGRKEFN